MSLKTDTSLPSHLPSIFPFQYHSKNELKQKKATTRIFEGLYKQIINFKEMAFKGQEITKNWSDSFKSLETEIKKAKKNVAYKATAKENFSKKLNESHKIFIEKLNELKEIENPLSNKTNSDVNKTAISKSEKPKNLLVSDIKNSLLSDIEIKYLTSKVEKKNFESEAEKKNLTNNIEKYNTLTETEKANLFSKIEKHNLLSEIEKINFISKVEKFNFTPVYENSKIELARLEEKIELYKNSPTPAENQLNNIFLRVRKVVPHYALESALKASDTKDTTRLERHKHLKTTMQETILSSNEAESLGNRLEWSEKVLIPLNENIKKLAKLTIDFEPMLKILNDLHTDNLSKKFKEKAKFEETNKEKNEENNADKPDLTFFIDLKKWEATVKDMYDLEATLDDIEKYSKASAPIMRATLGEISSAIKDYPIDKTLKDEDFLKKLDTQKTKAITAYTQLQNELEEKQNKFSLDLRALNFKVSYFNQLINLVANIAVTYKKADTAYQELRYTRVTQTKRNMHQNVYDAQKKIVEELRNTIHNQVSYQIYTPISQKFNSIPIQRDFNSCIIDLQKVELQPDLVSQRAQFEKVDKLILPATSTNAKNYGLVWHEGDAKEAEKLLTDQNIIFAEELKKQTDKIKMAFDTDLKQICTTLTYYLNRVGQTLKIETNDYDDKFNTAYQSETAYNSPLCNYIGSTALTLVGKSVTYGPYTAIKSPYDSKQG